MLNYTSFLTPCCWHTCKLLRQMPHVLGVCISPSRTSNGSRYVNDLITFVFLCFHVSKCVGLQYIMGALVPQHTDEYFRWTNLRALLVHLCFCILAHSHWNMEIIAHQKSQSSRPTQHCQRSPIYCYCYPLRWQSLCSDHANISNWSGS